MLNFIENLGKRTDLNISYTITLDADRRAVTRQKVITDEHQEVGILLNIGQVMQVNDILATEDGIYARIAAPLQKLIKATASDYLSFAKACYHLGNRHCKLQIEDKYVLFEYDKNLADLCIKLNLQVEQVESIFEPESNVTAHHHHHHEHS